MKYELNEALFVHEDNSFDFKVETTNNPNYEKLQTFGKIDVEEHLINSFKLVIYKHKDADDSYTKEFPKFFNSDDVLKHGYAPQGEGLHRNIID